MISLYNIGNKLAEKLGDTRSYGIDLAHRFNNFRQLTEYSPLQSLLPYQTYEPARKLFLNDDSIGLGFELMPLTGCSEDEIERLVSMFNDKLPDYGDLHIQLISSNKIGDILDRFYKARQTKNEKLALKRKEYYRRVTRKSINRGMPFYLRDYRLFLYYSEPIKQNQELQFESIENIREAFRTSLTSITIVNDVTVELFISILKDILNPNLDIYPSKANYDKLNRIAMQVLNSDTSFDVNENNLKVLANDAEFIIQNYNVESYPEQVALWQAGENIGKILEPSMQPSCPIIINHHLRSIDKTKSYERALTQCLRTEKKANSPLARLLPSLPAQYREWKVLADYLSGTKSMAMVSYQITTISQKENHIQDAIRIKDLYASNGYKISSDKYFQFPSFLQNLPFLMTSGLHTDLKYYSRFKTMSMFNAVNIMPLLAEYKGTANAAGLMFVGRRGQIANWSNFSNRDGNYNIAIAAKSRAGKSFLMQELIFDVLCQDGIVRVIDLGHSYEKFCKLVNGQYIEMTQGVCINPFTHVVDITKSLSQIKSIVATMAHPSGNISDKELSFIANSIQSAWDKKGNCATITDIALALSTVDDPVAKDLIILLQKYSKGGQFESYFEGRSTIDVKNPFIVFELEELKDKADLKSVVVLSIMLQITEEFYGLSRNIKKLCVIDEAWDLLHSSKQATEFIETGYRRMAKQNAAIATLVQSINDYFRNEMGIAIYENSDNQLILAQLDSTIDQLKNNQRLKFTPYEERLLRSFAGTNQYKECLIRTPSGTSLVRVLFDPFTRILYSTKGEEFEEVKNLVAEGCSMEEAVGLVAAKVYGDEYV